MRLRIGLARLGPLKVVANYFLACAQLLDLLTEQIFCLVDKVIFV